MATHIVSRTLYFAIFGILMVLTYATVQVAFFDLGPFNAWIALTIAVVKATLVVLYFMHVRYSTRLTWLTIAGGLFWLAILLTLTMSDYLTRAWLTMPAAPWQR